MQTGDIVKFKDDQLKVIEGIEEQITTTKMTLQYFARRLKIEEAVYWDTIFTMCPESIQFDVVYDKIIKGLIVRSRVKMSDIVFRIMNMKERGQIVPQELEEMIFEYRQQTSKDTEK